jgi:SAM-dependent methyltransferase
MGGVSAPAPRAHWDNQVAAPAAPGNATAIFAGRWVTDFSAVGLPGTGHAPLAEDARIAWLRARLDLAGLRALELGSFEGGHSLQLHAAGARVLGVEAHTEHFLKALVVKNALGLDGAQFLLGDFTAFLRADTRTFDLILACGVLYHMTNPAELIALCAARSPRLFLWSVVYDDAVVPDRVRPRISGPRTLSHDGFEYRAFEHRYAAEGGRALSEKGVFCGGTESFSTWLELPELLRVLGHYGYRVVDQQTNRAPNPRHGRNVLLLAERA